MLNRDNIEAYTLRLARRMLARPRLDERALLAPLIAQSWPFKRFYFDQRRHLPEPLYFIHDPSIPTPFQATELILERRLFAVRLKAVPLDVDDAIYIAHEMAHLMFFRQGFPGLACPLDSQISNAAQSIPHDLLVHSLLMKYGFDVPAALHAEFSRGRAELEALEMPPPNAETALLWMLNHAGHLLEQQLLLNQQPGTAGHSYFAWFAATYPHLAVEARALASFLAAIGWETPAQMGDSLAGMIHRYGLHSLHVDTGGR